jgi:hypothetical protein
VNTTYTPQGEKMSKLARDKERTRKDVERVFDVLQTHWAIVRHLRLRVQVGRTADSRVYTAHVRNNTWYTA